MSRSQSSARQRRSSWSGGCDSARWREVRHWPPGRRSRLGRCCRCRRQRRPIALRTGKLRSLERGREEEYVNFDMSLISGKLRDDRRSRYDASAVEATATLHPGDGRQPSVARNVQVSSAGMRRPQRVGCVIDSCVAVQHLESGKRCFFHRRIRTARWNAKSTKS